MAAETLVLDKVDQRIIGHLRVEGRISWKELADRVHLAQTPLVNWTLVSDDSGVILIDAGFPGSRDDVVAADEARHACADLCRARASRRPLPPRPTRCG